MSMHIHHVDRFDPMTEINSSWLDRKQLTASQRYFQIQQETLNREVQKPKFEDKIEFRGQKDDYRAETALPSDITQQALDDSRKEYLQDERKLAETSVLFRTYFRGGIGINFDSLA